MRRPTKPEKALQQALRNAGIKFTVQKELKVGTKWHKVDIFIKPNIVVEVDGQFFHNYPFGGFDDYTQTSWLRMQGYNVIRFWDSDVYSNIDGCIRTIRAAMRLRSDNFTLFHKMM
jgi:very-short-patch-repair endonuclease